MVGLLLTAESPNKSVSKIFSGCLALDTRQTWVRSSLGLKGPPRVRYPRFDQCYPRVPNSSLPQIMMSSSRIIFTLICGRNASDLVSLIARSPLTPDDTAHVSLEGWND
jgi:hypothetical protein